jgi:hypothetical protein
LKVQVQFFFFWFQRFEDLKFEIVKAEILKLEER